MDIKKIESFRDLLQNYQTLVSPTGVSYYPYISAQAQGPRVGDREEVKTYTTGRGWSRRCRRRCWNLCPRACH